MGIGDWGLGIYQRQKIYITNNDKLNNKNYYISPSKNNTIDNDMKINNNNNKRNRSKRKKEFPPNIKSKNISI